MTEILISFKFSEAFSHISFPKDQSCVSCETRFKAPETRMLYLPSVHILILYNVEPPSACSLYK